MEAFRSMSKPLATAALLLAWLCANGALLDGLQVFAWTRMFANYTQTMSVKAALRETFDPAKPCKLCIRVANAKSDLQQHALPPVSERASEKELVLALQPCAQLVLARTAEHWPEPRVTPGLIRHEDVPVPPPRA